MSQSVAHQVLNLPELLIIILWNVEPDPKDDSTAPQGSRTLLHAQRVNKIFRAVITGSIDLRQKLLLAQDSKPPTSRASETDPFRIERTSSRPHLVLLDPKELLFSCSYITPDERNSRVCHLTLRLHDAETQSQTLLNGSWRRMYADQRSYKVFSVSLSWMAHSRTVRYWQMKGGRRRNMTLGEMFDSVLDHTADGDTRKAILEPWADRNA